MAVAVRSTDHSLLHEARLMSGVSYPAGIRRQGDDFKRWRTVLRRQAAGDDRDALATSFTPGANQSRPVAPERTHLGCTGVTERIDAGMRATLAG